MTFDQLHALERLTDRLHAVLDKALAERPPRRTGWAPTRSPLPRPRDESIRILHRIGTTLHQDALRLGLYVDATEGRE